MQIRVGWIFELATSLKIDGSWGGWKEEIRRDLPKVPEGAIRNLRALWASEEVDYKDAIRW